ncbi:UNVERIFIED_CONTAM: hypothetical protein Sindi_1825600, partial [Sesamum indicum]
TVAKLLNMEPYIVVPQTPYEIWHDKQVFYKYLRVYGSPTNIKRLVGDKLESMSHSHYDEELLEESSEIPHQDSATPSVPLVPSNSALVFYRSTRISQHPNRYEFLGLTSKLDGDLTTYREAMHNIDSDKWLQAMNPK